MWVEDDPGIINAYPKEAAQQYGLELVPFSCWEDAEKALISDFKRWAAIILDAKCKYKKDDHDNAPRFLMHALNAIGKICTERKRVIPWFVLSGGSEEELSDLILDDREAWDGDWKDKKFYSKTTDRDMLFHRIPYKASISPELQIRLVYYPDVFKAIEHAELGDDVEVWMEELLLPIHAQNYTGKEYNNLMTSVRKCLEAVFHSMAAHGILPNEKQGGNYKLHPLLEDKRGGINTTWCSMILSGKTISVDSKQLITSHEILPKVLKNTFQNLIEIAAAYEHAPNKNVNKQQYDNSRHTDEFLDYVGNAPYLLRGMTMELCDIILWYAHYLDEHDDEELNALEWQVL